MEHPLEFLYRLTEHIDICDMMSQKVCDHVDRPEGSGLCNNCPFELNNNPADKIREAIEPLLPELKLTNLITK